MISGIVITLNEENNIQACIESLNKVCDEIIVVDSGSTDNTVDIAKKLGAIIINQPYLGDGLQKNVGLSSVKNKWVLTIDADERLHPDMVDFIKSLNLEHQDVDAFAFRRRNFIGSRWIKRCGWYPDFCTRLYNSESVRFAETKQHAKVKTNNLKKINTDIIHYSFNNIGELFCKPGRNFSSRAAKIMYLKGKRTNKFAPAAHGLNSFIRKYFFKMGILEGLDGLTIALSSGINSYLKYAKLYEIQNDQKVMEQQDFEKVW